MHLPSATPSQERIWNAFNHREMSGLSGFGECSPCEAQRRLRFQGIGEGPDPVTMGVSAATQLASVALASWLTNKKQNAMLKTYTTSVVNELEPLLRQNADAYRNGPASCANQAMALDAFDSAWQWLQSQQACGNPQLGTPGQNCINDRAPGGEWDWTAMYRTPIANDSRVAGCADAIAGTNAGNQSAAANIFNRIGGSYAQTNALDFASTTTGASNQVAGTSDSSLVGSVNSILANSPSVTVAGVQVSEYLLIGLLGIGVVMALGNR